MYLTPTENTWACDIEADALLDKATTIWCVTVENVITGEKHDFTDPIIFNSWFSDIRANVNGPPLIFVGHNFIAYDAVMLNRFWGTRININQIVDTYVLSQLYNPSMPRPPGFKGRKGPHSLEAWGHRLRFPKGDFNDFSHYSEEMLKYCAQDTTLTAKLFNRLTERMRGVGFSEEGAEIEHLAWNIIQNKQKKNGFPLDKQKAEELYVTIRQRESQLKDEIYSLWPPRLDRVAEYRRAYKNDGGRTAVFERHVEQYPKIEVADDGSYWCYDYVAFSLGSPSQRVEKLLELGWIPTQFTKRTPKGGGGNPRIDEDSLLAFAELSGQKEVLALSKWIVFNSRANMIRTWLDAYDEKTGAIHGSLFLNATLRYRHSNPNSANIPAVRLKKDNEGNEHVQYGEAGTWTYESRDLWTCGDPREFSLVGLDGTGIQNRCLIHHLINTVGADVVKPFKELALEGDIHKHNINVLGLANKAAAKKYYYSLMMGAGGEKLAADQIQFGTHMTPAEGDAKKRALVKSIPGFKDLIRKLKNELDKAGRIKLCDGTPILVSSPHMVIPYLLQGDESRLMKKTMIYIDQEVNRNGLREHVFKVADIHDEMQYRVRNEYAERFMELALPCFNRAGEFFDYNIPVDGDAKIGKTWAETH